jgi:hypothetical protein
MPDNAIALDDYNRASSELPQIAQSLVDERGDEVRDRFLFAPADPYTAFHGPRASA